MRQIEILLNTSYDRRLLIGELLRENPKSVIVRLPDGHIIKRKKQRDVIRYVGQEPVVVKKKKGGIQWIIRFFYSLLIRLISRKQKRKQD